MAREVHSDDIRTDQPRQFVDLAELAALLRGPIERPPEIVQADPTLSQDYIDELAFMNEWVTIRLEASGAENEAPSVHVMLNGEDAEVLEGDRVRRLGHLPIGYDITVRRAVVGILARSKTTRVATETERNATGVFNHTRRKTAMAQPMSIVEDRNPRGRAWFAEMVRREF